MCGWCGDGAVGATERSGLSRLPDRPPGPADVLGGGVPGRMAAAPGHLPRKEGSQVEGTCQALNRRGEPCQAPAGASGFCACHSGTVDMEELGRRGGSSRRRAGLDSVEEEFFPADLQDWSLRQIHRLSLSNGAPAYVRLEALKILYLAALGQLETGLAVPRHLREVEVDGR